MIEIAGSLQGGNAVAGIHGREYADGRTDGDPHAPVSLLRAKTRRGAQENTGHTHRDTTFGECRRMSRYGRTPIDVAVPLGGYSPAWLADAVRERNSATLGCEASKRRSSVRTDSVTARAAAVSK